MVTLHQLLGHLVLLEPTFFWEDSHYQIHKRYIEKSHYKKLSIFPKP